MEASRYSILAQLMGDDISVRQSMSISVQSRVQGICCIKFLEE